MLIIRLKMTELLLSDNKMISKYIYRFILVKKNKNSYTNKACKINTGNNPLLFFGLSGISVVFLVIRVFPVSLGTLFKSCREEIAGALQEFCNRWCKREHVESNALNSWKLNIFKIIDGRISFYCNNLDLLPPKPKFTF